MALWAHDNEFGNINKSISILNCSSNIVHDAPQKLDLYLLEIIIKL